jgi:preprotein translocase subunit SecG
MFVLASVDALHYVFMIPLLLLSIFLILVILVQRGRGGGLTGALGGMGGQSAFGTKAGDLFTRITIVLATIWVLLSLAALKVLNDRSRAGGLATGVRGFDAPLVPGGKSVPGVPGTSLPLPDATAPASGTAPSTTPPPTATPTESAPSAAPPAAPAGANSSSKSPDSAKP